MGKLFTYLFLLIILFLTSCSAPPQSIPLLETSPWRYTDLRALKAPGGSPASQTLAALYTRKVGTTLQIRIDMLDFSTQPAFDLYLALETLPDGISSLPISAQAGLDWNTLVILHATGDVTAVDSQGRQIPGLKLLAMRDALQDNIVFNIEAPALRIGRNGYSLQVFVTPARSKTVSDSLGPVRSDAPTPPPASLLLVFWNTFPAVSPAQALRYWDGAHTGPFGGRHGLLNLLNASRADQIPLTLVDVKTAASLSALDTIGSSSSLLHSLIGENLLSMPDVLPVASTRSGSLLHPSDWALQRLAEGERLSAQAFQFPAEPFLYSPLPLQAIPQNVLSPYQLLFTASQDIEASSGPVEGCRRYQSWLALPLPTGLASSLSTDQVKASQQATLDGLSLDTRKALLSLAALNAASGSNLSDPCSGKVLLLGGNLAYSSWGEPFMAQAAMDYIAGHPWMRAIRPEDFLGGRATIPLETQPTNPAANNTSLQPRQDIPFEPSEQPIASGLNTAQIESRLLDELQSLPASPLAQAAWQMYTSLIQPVFPLSPTLYPLRAAYLNQVGIFLAAAKWAASSQISCEHHSQVSCAYAQDVDWDGKAEYILASKAYFGIFEQSGGFLEAAFALDQSGVHQIVGPSWQFSVGLADPSTWQVEKGIAGDPRALRGAFSEIPAGYAEPSWDDYSVQTAVQTGLGEITFTSPDGRLVKTIRLEPQGFVANYISKDEVRVQMPLVVDPWVRFSPGWEQSYTPSASSQTASLQSWTWGLVNGVQASLAIDGGNFNVQPFSITQQLMNSPENPDFQYPAGHYLPFPMALATADGKGKFSITLGLINN